MTDSEVGRDGAGVFTTCVGAGVGAGEEWLPMDEDELDGLALGMLGALV